MLTGQHNESLMIWQRLVCSKIHVYDEIKFAWQVHYRQGSRRNEGLMGVVEQSYDCGVYVRLL